MKSELVVEKMKTELFLEKFKPTPFNPASRTSPQNLRVLIALMKKNGFWKHKPIEVVGDTIADGNRRSQAAKFAGVEYVYFTRVEGISIDVAYAEGNTAKPHTTRQVGEAILKGLNEIPPSRYRSVQSLLEACGGDWAKMRSLLAQGAGPGMTNMAARCATHCGFEDKDDTRNEFIVRTILWMTKHHNSGRLR